VGDASKAPSISPEGGRNLEERSEDSSEFFLENLTYAIFTANLILQPIRKHPFYISYRLFARTKNFNTTFEKIFCVHVRVNEPCVVINV
jgi:hypothetical protein